MATYILADFPEKEQLIMEYRQSPHPASLAVNCHLHTPHSFSYFNSIGDIFGQAMVENIKVLGINDFYSSDGFNEFYAFSQETRIFPLFNIEITGLLREEQHKKIRINDPVNPGRIYVSGKGLDYPFELDLPMECMLRNARYEVQLHIKEIIEKASEILSGIDRRMNMKFSEVKRIYAREFITERHVARAIRDLIYDHFTEDAARNEILGKIIGGDGLYRDKTEHADVENRIRSRFLKSGGRAFVSESWNAFLPLSQVLQIILNAGGIPCYTLLLDDESGQCTEFEADKHILMNELLARNIHCIEFMPFRNSAEILHEYASYFRNQGFIVLFGTAHSSPESKPLGLTTRDGAPLDEVLSRIAYEGASVIAAHQYLRAKGRKGFLDPSGKPGHPRIDELIEIGQAVIHKFLNN